MTGDGEAVASEVAKALDIERYWAEQSLHNKLELVKKLQKTEVVAMVGWNP
jgi:cation transport ATPase